MARMKDLATNRGDALRRSKKSRASLRSTFRELCSSVEVSSPESCLFRIGHVSTGCQQESYIQLAL